MNTTLTACFPLMLALCSAQAMANTIVIKHDGAETQTFTTAKIVYSGEVSPQGVMELITSLDEIHVAYPAVTAITLYLNSIGGSMADGYMAYEAIKYSPVPVTTVNTGEVASAATLMYCGGKTRLVFSAATFLLHPSSTSNYYGDSLDPNDLALLTKNVEMGNDFFRFVYPQCTNFTHAQIEKILFAEGNSLHIRGEEAIRVKLASRIAYGLAPTAVSYYITVADKAE